MMSPGGGSPGQQHPRLSTTYDSIATGMASSQQAAEACEHMGASQLPPQHGRGEAGQGPSLQPNAGKHLSVELC